MFILSSLKLNAVISLGEYINAVVSRIVIGTLDLKQFLPKFKYFCWRQQGLDPLPPPPLSATVSISKPPPPSAADVICGRSLSKAFDTIEHGVLLDKLEHYGIGGKLHTLIKSYISCRTQQTKILGMTSDKCFVKQGSVLGSCFF